MDDAQRIEHDLRRSADEICREGHNGWGNTCEEAADLIARLRVDAERYAWLRANLLKVITDVDATYDPKHERPAASLRSIAIENDRRPWDSRSGSEDRIDSFVDKNI